MFHLRGAPLYRASPISMMLTRLLATHLDKIGVEILRMVMSLETLRSCLRRYIQVMVARSNRLMERLRMLL